MKHHITLQKYYEATKIPLQLYSGTEQIKNFAKAEFHPNPANNLINCGTDLEHSIGYTVSPEYLFCGLIRIEDSTEYVLVGPAMAFECSRKQAENILTRLQQPVNRVDEFLRWVRTIPNCDLQRFRGILCFLDYLLNGTSEHDPVQLPYQTNSLPMHTIDSGPSFIEQVSDLFEKQILSYIEHGNSSKVEEVWNNLHSFDGGIPLTTSDALRSLKNIFIFATGLASRAAMKGGLDLGTVNSLTDIYIKKIEQLDNYGDILILLKQMFLEFAKRTARSRSYLSDSVLVNKISKDIQVHLYEKVTPADIAERLNMNGSYLSRHFKEQTGKTITEFINEVKIKEGIRLLETTEMPLIQISTQLGFSSQNYFQTVFKKITGKTPIEYRKKKL
ncbi:MAG: helix-turn-helix domain-containing protein [Neobacillus sp.]